MKLPKFILFIFVLPLTLVLDFILYALTRSCPNCSSFWQWIETEGALSFPIVIGLVEWIGQFIPESLKSQTHKNR